MERLMEDAVHVQNLLPWIESDEDIINFMRKIPLNKSHLRNQLTLRYFLKERDSSGDGFEKDIEDDAREIVSVMPGTSYKDVKDRLTILGNMPNRKEVVLRQLLHNKPDLDIIIREIDTGFNKKRKSNIPKEVLESDLKRANETDVETNIKIKIRKIEGSVEVVSSITEKTSPTKVANITVQSPNKTSLSITPSTSSHSETSTPDSTVSTPLAETEDSSDSMEGVNEYRKNIQPSTLGAVMAVGCWRESTSTHNKDKSYVIPPISSKRGGKPMAFFKLTLGTSENKKNKNIGNELSESALKPKEETSEGNTNDNNIGDEPIESPLKPKEEISERNTKDNDNNIGDAPIENLLKPKEETLESNMNDNDNNIESKIIENSGEVTREVILVGDISDDDNIIDDEPFNLIDSIHEVSQYPKGKIRELCRYHKLPIDKRPNSEKFNFILNELYDNEIVYADNSDISSSNSETQEYDLDDVPLPLVGLNLNWKNNTKVVVKQPTGKEFKLKEPVLNIGRTVIPQTKLPSTIVRPARLNLHNEQIRVEENIIPAMPRTFLEKQQAKETAVVEEVLPDDWTPVDLTGPEEYKPLHENLDPDKPGPSKAQNPQTKVVDESLIYRLIEMFPEACPDYIRGLCNGKKWADFNDVITEILSAADYPKRPQREPSPVKEVDPEEQFQIVKELLPDADPDYLRMHCDKYANDEKGLKEFINRAVELKDYPTMKEYLRKQQLSAQKKQYTTEFSIDKFIELFPDPEKTFNDPSRVVQIDQMTSHYIVIFFRNKYPKINARLIQQVLIANNFKPTACNIRFSMIMETNRNILKYGRKVTALPDNLQNIPLLQELAYITHKDEIEKYLADKQIKEEIERLQTKSMGRMQTCQCCYDEEVMPKDTFSCPNGCKFCRDCIQKSCEVAFGEGKLVFPCLADCSSEFTLQTLQNVLPPKMFSKVVQKQALKEIKAAGIDDLVTCPFCDFASIPNEADKIFRCLNPDCMKESCRLCREPNHIPLKCEEVEKDQDVKARTHIEDAMTKALIRTCWKCGTNFFKEEGCNKMTCSCGAQMCYICKKPVKDYTHFNGIGGDKFHLCPLYSDTNSVNQENVMKAAEAAKAQVNPANLKVDPTADVEAHYSNRRRQLPREPHMDAIHIRHAVAGHRHRHHHIHHFHHRHVGHAVPNVPEILRGAAPPEALQDQMQYVAEQVVQMARNYRRDRNQHQHL